MEPPLLLLYRIASLVQWAERKQESRSLASVVSVTEERRGSPPVPTSPQAEITIPILSLDHCFSQLRFLADVYRFQWSETGKSCAAIISKVIKYIKIPRQQQQQLFNKFFNWAGLCT
ncbi:hypothetical protein PoB_004752600 [Plakobranchus ocellatus]|uniref:Uncharacterized protein n=1 Tax=Plakobranchus ocellatus TaxID=259542 RepID=A0AAV4BKU9_9GAST|nr:hypothetical protein PoB_004752600 [Plakobranchus ocellatus]